MPVNDLSQMGTLFFNQGMLGFENVKNGKNRVGKQVMFFPCVSIDQYEKSDTKERYFRHIIYDIYEFTFKPIAKYQHNDQPEGYYKFKDLNHYLLELSPGFNVFHFNWNKVHKEYLQIGTLYSGYGRLSTCDNPALYNPKIDPKAMKSIRCKGIIKNATVNLIWREFSENYIDANDGPKDAISYEDALTSIGYPDNELKFRVNVSSYKGKIDELSNPGHKKDSDQLVYCIKML